MATGTAVEVVMPQMGVSVSEGTITRWLKSEGDAVAADEPLLEISTDKVDTEVPCPADGVLARILVDEGETVAVGTLGVVPRARHDALRAARQRRTGTGPGASAPARPAAARRRENGQGEGRAFVSPVVARIAAEHGVDVSRVPGTGRGGRVTKKDILAYVESGAPEAAPPAPPARDPARGAACPTSRRPSGRPPRPRPRPSRPRRRRSPARRSSR